jgi:hypothetical protein
MEPITPFETSDRSEPSSPPTPEQLSQATRIASLGVRAAAISHFFSVSLPQLIRVCGPQIAAAARALHREVFQSLCDMALSRRHPAATVFWLKTYGPALPPSPAPSPTPSQKPPKPESSGYYTGETFELNVYCNDGEPNADY